MIKIKFFAILALNIPAFSLLTGQESKSPESRVDSVISRIFTAIDEGKSLKKFKGVRDTLVLQLNYINRLAQEQSIQEKHYMALQSAYGNMKSVYDGNLQKLRDDISSFATIMASNRNVKEGVEQWINQLETGYKNDYEKLNGIYQTQFTPYLDSARLNSGAKTVPLVLQQIAVWAWDNRDVIIKEVRDFFKNKLNFKKTVISLLQEKLTKKVAEHITKEYELPAWESKVKPYSGYVSLVPAASNFLPPGIPPSWRDQDGPQSAPPFRVLRTREFNVASSVTMARNGVDTVAAIRNGLHELFPRNGMANSWIGDYAGAASYTLRTNIGFHAQSDAFAPVFGHALVFHVSSREDGPEAAPEMGVFITLAQGGSTGHMLLMGRFSVLRFNEGGVESSQIQMRVNERVPISGYTPGSFLNLSLNIGDNNCTVMLDDRQVMRYNDSLFNGNADQKLYYILYNGTGVRRQTQTKPAKMFTDYIKINSISEAGQEDLSPRSVFNPTANPTERTRYHVVCIGISKYAESRLNLNYAEKDARAVNKVYGNSGIPVRTYLLTDSEATKKGIVDTLRKVMDIARKNDVLIIYYSGHGSKGGILPSDYKSSDQRSILSYDEMLAILNRKQLKVKGLLLDACYSGSAASSLTSRSSGMDQQPGDRLQSLLSGIRNGQIFGLCSSSETQESFESADLRHGLFTYYLLSAFQAGDYNRSGFVSYGEMYHYIKYFMEVSENRSNQVLTPIGTLQYRMPVITVGRN